MGLETLALVGLGTGLAATGIGTYGALEQADSQKRMADYNASVAELNAEAQRKDAQAQIGSKRADDRRNLARMKASVAAGGAEISGSPLLSLADAQKNMEMENQNISYASQVNRRNLYTDASMYRMQGKAAKTQGYLAGTGTLLSGLSSTASNYTFYNSRGLM